MGIVVGPLVLGAVIYCLIKKKNDPESKKICGIVSAVGTVVAIAAAIILFARV